MWAISTLDECDHDSRWERILTLNFEQSIYLLPFKRRVGQCLIFNGSDFNFGWEVLKEGFKIQLLMKAISIGENNLYNDV